MLASSYIALRLKVLVVVVLALLTRWVFGQDDPFLLAGRPVEVQDLDPFAGGVATDGAGLLDSRRSGSERMQNFFDAPIAALPFSLAGSWMTDANSGLSNYSVSVKVPILKLFDGPPPIINVGFVYTDLIANSDLGLPRDLYEYSIGVSRFRKINERWGLRTMLGVAFATDNNNTSGDAWQFRGGAFGIYRANDCWSWTVGAIALGRSDLPVVPAVGFVYSPNEFRRLDFILPNPTMNYLLSDNGQRQQWFYFGGGFTGSSWGYEQVGTTDDILTYRDLRIVAGLKSTPTGPRGVPFVRGRKNTLEFGFVFDRDLEFNNESTSVSLDNAFLIRIGTDY